MEDRADWIHELRDFGEFAGAQYWGPAFGIEDTANEIGALRVEYRDPQCFIMVDHIYQTPQADDA